ncbi:photosystem II core complex proteins psbY, chloroplastic [Arachis duranensis]|uniref:Photosystem II core complex proteins psbY, chloroplastic n=1 Tax=Arachis duranensis TaxID=130453 RepID=A0A6P4BKT3_ARADU|nr:photosystem II core complex proteins psbY, chloroplastic [Arachis duranensis]
MAVTIATMAMVNAKFLNTNSPKFPKPTSSSSRPAFSLLSLENLPKGLATTKSSNPVNLSTSMAGTAIAGAIFSTLGASDAAFAAQQIADIADGDNRGLALLLPIIPAIAWVLFNILSNAADAASDNRGQLLLFVVAPAILWVLYNILQPALNQLNRMRSQ